MEQFKRAKVIMLPTKELLDAYKAPITKVYEDNGKLYINKKEIGELITELGSPQHLYVISDDDLLSNEYGINILTNEIIQNGDKNNNVTLNDWKSIKRIIATTDSLLFKLEECLVRGSDSNIKYILPQPSQQFIEKYIEEYNKGNIIINVLVEYDNLVEDVYSNQHLQTENDSQQYLATCTLISSNIKVNPKDNTITIKKIKDNWNKEELDILFESYRECAWIYGNTKQVLADWKNKNL